MPEHRRNGLLPQERSWAGVGVVEAAVLHMVIQGPRLTAASKAALEVHVPARPGKEQGGMSAAGGTRTATHFLTERTNHMATSKGKHGWGISAPCPGKENRFCQTSQVAHFWSGG